MCYSSNLFLNVTLAFCKNLNSDKLLNVGEILIDFVILIFAFQGLLISHFTILIPLLLSHITTSIQMPQNLVHFFPMY